MELLVAARERRVDLRGDCRVRGEDEAGPALGLDPVEERSYLVVDHDLEREVSEAVVRKKPPAPLERLDDIREPLTRDLGTVLDERDPGQVARSASRGLEHHRPGEEEVVLSPSGRTSVTCT